MQLLLRKVMTSQRPRTLQSKPVVKPQHLLKARKRHQSLLSPLSPRLYKPPRRRNLKRLNYLLVIAFSHLPSRRKSLSSVVFPYPKLRDPVPRVVSSGKMLRSTRLLQQALRLPLHLLCQLKTMLTFPYQICAARSELVLLSPSKIFHTIT